MDQMVTGLRYVLAVFTPAEAAALSGLSPAMQRDWRHRGLLPSHQTHARYDVFGIAELVVMKMLADQGKGPSLSKNFAPAAANAIVYTAITWSEKAWSSDPKAAYHRLSVAPATDDQKLIDVALDFFERHLGRKSLEHGPHAIWWPTDEFEIGNYSRLSGTVDAQGTETKEGDPRFQGAAIVLPLDTIAANIVRRSPRALVEIV